jgi:hypothetical protein
MRIRALVLSLACSFAASLAQAQSLIAHYQFNGNLNNSVAGSALPALEGITPEGGLPNAFTTEAGAWTWTGASSGPGIGLRLPTADLLDSYESFSIGIVFKFSNVGAPDDYRKIIDFKNGTSDDGLYFTNGGLTAFDSTADPANPVAGSFTANQTVALVFTRHSEGQVNVYANGSTTPLITHTVPNNAFLFSQGTSGTLRFFVDDNLGSEYSPAGAVYDIRVWDGVLSSGQVGTYFAAIPEPSTYAAFGGLMALGFVIWHRRRKSAGKVQS